MTRPAPRFDETSVIPMSGPPAQAECEIAGHRYRFTFWDHQQWERTEESLRPPQAQPLGSAGWFILEPSEQ